MAENNHSLFLQTLRLHGMYLIPSVVSCGWRGSSVALGWTWQHVPAQGGVPRLSDPPAGLLGPIRLTVAGF